MDDRERERRIREIYWERGNLARDIQAAQRDGRSKDALAFRDAAWKLWQELVQLERTIAS